jgi:pyruvate kinase
VTRRAKIVCTLGPATYSDDKVRALVEAGMDVARLNFSLGDHADHRAAYDQVRNASDSIGRAVGVLVDLQGPKVRLGRFATGPTYWNNGDTVRITVAECSGTHHRVSTTNKQLATDTSPGDRLLVDAGNIELVVTRIDGDDVVCTVTEGGRVSDHKGLSLPGMNVSVAPMSDKDIDDLGFALRLGADLVALSSVRSPADVKLVHDVMDRVGRRVPVIAKLENPDAIDNLEAIVQAFDAVMVARGALGVEVPLEEVPLVQKRAIQIAREHAKPVIVATQMLESMIHNARPTQAEASDVANAVFDGADAVMLSDETAVGRRPLQAVKTMSRIVSAIEQNSVTAPPLMYVPRSKYGVISYAARDIAERLNAKALVAFTHSGDTVRRLARLHTPLPLLAFTALPEIRSQLALTWGTETFIVPEISSTDGSVRQVDRALLAHDRYRHGDLLVIVAGAPPGTAGATNLIHLHQIGEDHR